MPYKLLLAEDDDVNQIVISESLRHSGHEVVVVPDGVRALEALGDQTFDAVLMDVRMPRMNGRDATRRIRDGETGAPADIPVIGLSAYTTLEGQDNDTLMDDYVTKPVKFEELEKTLKRVIGDRKQD
jgi:CheY-like chemotaxis protein